MDFMKKILIIFSIGLLVFFAGCEQDISQNVTVDYMRMQYMPMQCEVEPWDEWISNSDIRFVKAPTQGEIVTMYYSEIYNIEVKNYERIIVHEIVCEACYICPKGYEIRVDVKKSDVERMQGLGWEIK